MERKTSGKMQQNKKLIIQLILEKYKLITSESQTWRWKYFNYKYFVPLFLISLKPNKVFSSRQHQQLKQNL